MELLLPIALIALGLGLIAAELYLVPGLNVFGVLGFFIVVFSVGYVFTEAGVAGGVLVLLGTLVVGGAMLITLWKMGAIDRLVLIDQLRADTSLEEKDSHRARFLGMTGRAVTPLRPTGVVEVEGERLEAMTKGEFIASGSEVKVMAMDRKHFFVRLEKEDVTPEAS